jgi:hypothetical protein
MQKIFGMYHNYDIDIQACIKEWCRGKWVEIVELKITCDNVISYTALRLSLLFRSPDIFIDWSISERRLVVV